MWRRSVHALMLALLVFATFHPAAPAAEAKEFTIEGTIDCGKPTGKLCIPIGRKIGVLTESVSGKREHVIVDISWMLDKPIRRDRQQQLATEGHQVARGLLFTALREKIDALSSEGIPTDRVSRADAQALVKELIANYLEVNADVIRHNLGFIVTHLRQDAAATISVTDEQGPTLLATMFHDRFDFMTSTDEGQRNTGALTGSDPDKDMCFDFVEDGLNWAFEKIEDQGDLELNDVEERFFDFMDDLPDPCLGFYDNVEVMIADRVTRTLQADRTKLRERLRIFLDRNPQVLLKIRLFIFTTILKKRGTSDRVRSIERELSR